MLKLLSTDDFSFDDAPLRQIPFCTYGVDRDFVKSASVFQDVYDSIKPDKDTTYVHVLAVGDTESSGCNRNGDGFSKKANIKYHDRFVKSGRVHRNHDNKDPARAVGKCGYSAHNDEMGRIELILGLDNTKCAEEVDLINREKQIKVSMGCKVAEEICSICNHSSSNPSERCEHTKTAMGKILEDGRQVYVDNPDPNYFEISLVSRPADRTAYSFRKVASECEDVHDSVELFKRAGLWVPISIAETELSDIGRKRLDVMKKLSEMEKEIEVSVSPINKSLMDATPDMDSEALSKEDTEELKKTDSKNLNKVFGTLNEAKVMLPLKDFLNLINKDGLFATDEVAGDVADQLPGSFSRVLEGGFDDLSLCCDNGLFDSGASGAVPDSLINRLIPDFGLGAEPIDKRVSVTIIKGPNNTKKASYKQSDDLLIKGLANLYTAYKLAFVTGHDNDQDPVLCRTVVLHNFKG